MSQDATGASNYLPMEGSVYIPMAAAGTTSLELPDADKAEDEAKGYADKLRRRVSSAGEAIPLKPMQKVEPVARSESSPVTSNQIPSTEHSAAAEPIDDDSPKETTALVHHDGERSPETVMPERSDGPVEATASEPLLPPQTGIPMRPKKGCNSNESMTSNASSGFHSDYIPDMNSAPPNYDLVMGNGHAHAGGGDESIV